MKIRFNVNYETKEAEPVFFEEGKVYDLPEKSARHHLARTYRDAEGRLCDRATVVTGSTARATPKSSPRPAPKPSAAPSEDSKEGAGKDEK